MDVFEALLVGRRLLLWTNVQPRMARSMASGFLERAPFSRLGIDQPPAEVVGQSRHHLILQLEEIGYVLLEAVGPKMRAGFRVDKLRVDAHAVLIALHRAFEHVADAEFLADLLGVDALAFEGEGGVAGDDEAAFDARKSVVRFSVTPSAK